MKDLHSPENLKAWPLQKLLDAVEVYFLSDESVTPKAPKALLREVRRRATRLSIMSATVGQGKAAQ